MSPTNNTLLTVDGLNVHLGNLRARRHIIKDADFTVGEGESVGVIGESGSGKTTLARAVLGLAKPSSGRITFGDQEVTAFTVGQWTGFRKAGRVQYVFQDPLRSLDPELTVGRSLVEPLQIQGKASREQVRNRAEELAVDVNLEPALLNRYPAELSGGQRQRVAVARGLISDPQLLILDEPVSALDSANRVQVLKLLERLRKRGISLVFISHDLGSVAGITDRVVVLYRGQIVEQGATHQIINSPQHPYTRLLVGSAPTLSSSASLTAEERNILRAELAAA